MTPSLESLYDNRAAVPEHAEIFARWRAQSLATRTAHRGAYNLAYGPHARQALDLIAARQKRGLVIFIHGGYWRSLDKDHFSFFAEPYLADGISVALINYRLCPTVKIEAIVDDCRCAVAWLAANSQQFAVDFANVALIGHSVGAHLVATLLATEWPAKVVDPRAFRGALGISGLYDLMPLLQVSVNDDLKLDPVSARALSPIYTRPRLSVDFDLVVGAAETSEFVRQTYDMRAAWPERCGAVQALAGANHFTVVDRCAEPSSATFQASLRFFV
jgi:arylformamidase